MAKELPVKVPPPAAAVAAGRPSLRSPPLAPAAKALAADAAASPLVVVAPKASSLAGGAEAAAASDAAALPELRSASTASRAGVRASRPWPSPHATSFATGAADLAVSNDLGEQRPQDV